VAQVRERSATVIEYEAGQEQAIYDLIERENITHIYLGAESAPLTRETFAGRPDIVPVYEQDGITILAVE
jgi:hypothetical protein